MLHQQSAIEKYEKLDNSKIDYEKSGTISTLGILSQNVKSFLWKIAIVLTDENQ